MRYFFRQLGQTISMVPPLRPLLYAQCPGLPTGRGRDPSRNAAEAAFPALDKPERIRHDPGDGPHRGDASMTRRKNRKTRAARPSPAAAAPVSRGKRLLFSAAV